MYTFVDSVQFYMDMASVVPLSDLWNQKALIMDHHNSYNKGNELKYSEHYQNEIWSEHILLKMTQ